MGNTFRLCGREVWMPWKASSVMEERLRFVARLLDGDAMTDVCRDFGVSRKTGYKRSLQGARPGGPERSLQAAGTLCQSAAAADREPDCPAQGRETTLGSPQDPRIAGQAARRHAFSLVGT